jgi:hypothetical protein
VADVTHPDDMALEYRTLCLLFVAFGHSVSGTVGVSLDVWQANLKNVNDTKAKRIHKRNAQKRVILTQVRSLALLKVLLCHFLLRSLQGLYGTCISSLQKQDKHLRDRFGAGNGISDHVCGV